ncbi:MAG: hypothetical protein ABIY50_07625 [Ignavibacteria bacterium]
MNPDKNLIELLKELSKAHVKYIICGGVACVLHGVERATYDIDLSVSFEKSNLQKIVEVTKRFNLKPRIPEPVENLYNESIRKDWVEKKDALVYTFVSDNSPLQLDVFLSYPKSYEELFINCEEVVVDEIKMNVSSLSDLIEVKKLIDPLRDKDRSDIIELERIISKKN